MKNYRRNNCIGKMKKGFKQKLSLLMIACLLFTGYQGLTISGRADSSHPEQNNEIEVSGSQVKVQLLGADLRRAATEAILKGEKVGKTNLRSYSKDQELATEFEEYFDGEKEIYNIPLNSIAENLEESLNAEEAGLQIYVERDAKNLEKLVRKESKESLLLYSKESAVAGLLPKKEEATTVSLTEEEKASDSNLERNTELTGSELITFVYENKSTERMTFQLSVDGNKYPKVTVSSKTSLFKQFLSDAKKTQAEAKNAKATEAKAETSAAQTTEEAKAEVESTEAKQESTEAQTTEESKASEEAQKDSNVAIVSTAAEATEGSFEATEAKVEEKVEASEEVKEEKIEAPAEEAKEVATEAETAKAEKATEAVKASAEDTGLLKEITEHSEEFLPELHTVRFTQYSLNELGRKSQNVEVEGFGNVQVFYEEAAFDSEVVLEAKRLFKPEEEVEGEKLSEEQVKVLKEHSIYDDAASLDIRFVDKKDNAVEVEPKSPVSVRITIDKKALPENVSSDSISIHHLVENDETKEIERVETVVRSKKIESFEANIKYYLDNDLSIKVPEDKKSSDLNENESLKNTDSITKEFIVDSFSIYQIHFKDTYLQNCPPINIHYVDKNFNEIGPTTRYEIDILTEQTNPNQRVTFYDRNKAKALKDLDKLTNQQVQAAGAGKAMKTFPGYKFHEVYPFARGQDNWDTDTVSKNSNDFFDFRYKYSNTGDLGLGVDYIDTRGFARNYEDKKIDIKWFWWDSAENRWKHCGITDFYFVYDIEPQPGVKRDEPELKYQNEKYITDNLDGTYNLTLTGQVNAKSKENLDIIFLVDDSRSMNLPFERDNNYGRYSANDYAKNETSRKAKTEEYIKNMVDDLSSNPNYNINFGLVGFGSSRGVDLSNARLDFRTISVYNAVDGSFLGNKEEAYVYGTVGITDTKYNDAHIYGLSDAETFKNNLNKLTGNRDTIDGKNYTAAMIGLHYILEGVGKNTIPDNLIVDGITPRSDAKKIVIMLSDGDPTYSYVREKGEYDEEVLSPPHGVDNKFTYKKELEAGYTYGNGVGFSRVGLNQARGYLSRIKNLSAFYTVGIGNTDNWKHLKELTVAHGYDQSRDWSIIGQYKNKFINAKPAVGENVASKVFDGSSPEKLKESFEELTNTIAPRVTNISITDTLSENVDLVENSTLEYGVYKMTDAVNGVKLSDQQIKKDLGKNVSLKPFVEVGDNEKPKFGVRLKPDDFSLPAGYEIRVTAKIKPSKIAYEKLARNEANENQGGKRTDLYSLYKHYLGLASQNNPYSSINYKISEDEFGLWTNQKAEFNYKWKGKDNPKDYPNPIIKVKGGELKIEKQITGLNGKAYINSVGFTKLGISVLKDITFTVYEVNENEPDKVYLTFKPYQDGVSGEQSNEGVFTEEKTKTVIKRSQAKYNSNEDILTLAYTITGLNPNKKYRVVEDVIPNTYNSDSSTPDGKRYRLGGRIVDTSSYSTTSGQTIVIKNSYTEVSKRKITVTKVVENKFTGDFITGDDKNDVFDFYLRVYHPVRKWDKHGGAAEGEPVAFNKTELEQIRNSNPGKFLAGYEEVPPNSGTYALHFQLKHGQKMEFELDDNLAYDVSEKKTSDYEKVKIMKSKTGLDKEWITCGFGNPDKGFWFICELLQVNEYQYVKIVNTSKRLIVPTGVSREITPYLFGIFGFIAMAGAYLTISKKRREA